MGNLKTKEQILDEHPNFPCKITETQEEICVTRSYALEAMEKYLDQETTGYCKECEACGEEGCCPPTLCAKVKCSYGDTYLRDYQFALEFSDRLCAMFKDDKRIEDLHTKLYDKHYIMSDHQNQLYKNKTK